MKINNHILYIILVRGLAAVTETKNKECSNEIESYFYLVIAWA